MNLIGYVSKGFSQYADEFWALLKDLEFTSIDDYDHMKLFPLFIECGAWIEYESEFDAYKIWLKDEQDESFLENVNIGLFRYLPIFK